MVGVTSRSNVTDPWLTDPQGSEARKENEAQDHFITVQIPESDIWDGPPPPNYTEDDQGPSTGKKSSLLKMKLRSSKDKEEKTKGVRMRRSELTKYFLKDPKTKGYRKGVVEPPGGRKKWLQERIELFESGMLDEGAYEGNLPMDYAGLRKESVMTQAGKAMDFFGAPYAFYSGQGIIPNKKPSKVYTKQPSE